MPSANFIAGGNIVPSTIVTQAGQADFTVIQATSSSVPLAGIAQDGTHDAPGVTGSSSYAATAGKGIRVFGLGEECLCVASTTITVNNLIKSDSIGQGTPVTASDSITTFVVGRALEGATGAGILFRIMVSPQEYVKI